MEKNYIQWRTVNWGGLAPLWLHMLAAHALNVLLSRKATFLLEKDGRENSEMNTWLDDMNVNIIEYALYID